jgi:hypothetical protein
VGVRIARQLGIAFGTQLPRIVAIRVTPWPVTSAIRVARFAQRTSQLVSQLSARPEHQFSFAELYSGLSIDGRYIGRGYGRPTPNGLSAMRAFESSTCVLDTTYSAKSAAALLDLLNGPPLPTLYWATKSSVPLPKLAPDAPPPVLRDWLAQRDSSRPTTPGMSA